MRATILTIAILLLAAAPAAAGEIVLEPGATFDGGVCWEADGTEGISSFDGQCVTPADYDILFSYEALAAAPSGIEGVSVAEAYGVTADAAPASERRLVFQGVDYGTFASYVTAAHQVAL